MPTPKPQATQIKALHGNPGRRPLSEREPQPAGDLSDAPAWFTVDQRACWDYAIENAPAGLLRILDRAVLAAFVVAEDLHRQATVKQAAHGLIRWIGPEPAAGEPDNRTFVQSPFLAVINKQAMLMVKCASELGFTPSSRSRIVVETEALSTLGRVPPSMLRPGKAPPPVLTIQQYIDSAPEIPRVS